VVASHGPHHGEEDPLRGWRGQGTVVFTWCNPRCVFCQDWDISQKGLGDRMMSGRPVSDTVVEAFRALGVRRPLRASAAPRAAPSSSVASTTRSRTTPSDGWGRCAP
jgi:pyruvate-formate lyase-activating enzyme